MRRSTPALASVMALSFVISDPVMILRAQFFGDARIRCDDAADDLRCRT